MNLKTKTYRIHTNNRIRFLVAILFASLICFTNIINPESSLQFESDKMEKLADAEIDLDVEEKEKDKEFENDFIFDDYSNKNTGLDIIKNLGPFNPTRRIYYSNIPTPPPDLA